MFPSFQVLVVWVLRRGLGGLGCLGMLQLQLVLVFCCVACMCPAAGVDGNLGIGRAGGFRRGRGSMARTSLWFPAHWVRDRLVDSPLALWAVFWGCWLREKNWDCGEGSCLSAISCDSRLQDQVQEHKETPQIILILRFYEFTEKSKSSSKLSISIQLRTGGICRSFDLPIDPACRPGQWMDRKRKQRKQR